MDSYYASRANSPDYISENGSERQVFVKEHARSTSKGSSSSFLSLKKAYQGKSRPETKVSLALFRLIVDVHFKCSLLRFIIARQPRLDVLLKAFLKEWTPARSPLFLLIFLIVRVRVRFPRMARSIGRSKNDSNKCLVQ